MSTKKVGLPNIRDYAQIHPPYASIVVGRTPVIQWHATEGGARRSAFGGSNVTLGEPQEPYGWHKHVARNACGIARLAPDGSLNYIVQVDAGEEFPIR